MGKYGQQRLKFEATYQATNSLVAANGMRAANVCDIVADAALQVGDKSIAATLSLAHEYLVEIFSRHA